MFSTPALVTSPTKYVPNKAERRALGLMLGAGACAVSGYIMLVEHVEHACARDAFWQTCQIDATGEPLFMCSQFSVSEVELTSMNLRRRQPGPLSTSALHLRLAVSMVLFFGVCTTGTLATSPTKQEDT